MGGLMTIVQKSGAMSLFGCVLMGFPFRGKNEVEDSINLAIHLTSFQVAQLPICAARSLYTQ
jgi:hypothetical protein